jgi:hypothetical protein
VPAARRPLAGLLTSVIVFCLVPLGIAAPALGARKAAPRPVSPRAVATAESVAAGVWGVAACSGKVAIAWRARPRSVNAVSSWANRISPYGDPQGNFDCKVEFNPRAAWTWAKFCTVLVHEFGHLTGHRHSADPHDVMAPVLGEPLTACAAAPRPPVA